MILCINRGPSHTDAKVTLSMVSLGLMIYKYRDLELSDFLYLTSVQLIRKLSGTFILLIQQSHDDHESQGCTVN